MRLIDSENLRRWVERALLAMAVIGLGWYVIEFAAARIYQVQQSRAFDAQLHDRSLADRSAPAERIAPGSVVGRIEIPRLGVSAIIREGDDDRTLRLAVGHIPGTAIPGGAGNAGLAGHRDTFFRKLRNVKRDDEIRITTPTGIHSYRVDQIRIVQPSDVWVLAPPREHLLTLVSCYPFSFIGSAPERFIVQARLSDFPKPKPL